MSKILMPKATAVWLIENTALTFDQIADFTGLHHLEVKNLALEESHKSIRGVDPIAGGELLREEVEKGQKDPNYRLKALEAKRVDIPPAKRKGPRYTPLSRRQDRPDAIAWILRNHPEMPDAMIVKLLGTTKATIDSVRNRTHWNSSNIKPVDPVTIGLTTQTELDQFVARAGELKAREDLKKARLVGGPTLKPAAETGKIAIVEDAGEDD